MSTKYHVLLDIRKLAWALAAFDWRRDEMLFHCLSEELQSHYHDASLAASLTVPAWAPRQSVSVVNNGWSLPQAKDLSAVDASVIVSSFARLGKRP